MYQEVEPAKALRPNKPQIDSLPAIGGGDGSVQNNLLNAVPKGVGLCKSFDEIKLYWADNYKVKVVDEIGKLNFEAVRAAMSGVEAVLEEFPQARSFLREFNVFSSGLMSTWRGHSKIYFNPEYFSNISTLISIITNGIKTGYYPKNMNVLGAGTHEAGHIVEDWLREKHNENTETLLRILPRKLIREAYQQAALHVEGKNKSIEQMRSEISTHASLENLSECLADAICDYIINDAKAALLSREIWNVLKGELFKCTRLMK